MYVNISNSGYTTDFQMQAPNHNKMGSTSHSDQCIPVVSGGGGGLLLMVPLVSNITTEPTNIPWSQEQ